VEILRPLRLRYFSPEELLRLFCFEDAGSDSTFRWPEGVSTKTKYRLIGNSVNVLVVSALIEYLCQRYYGFRYGGAMHGRRTLSERV
jgi:tRNA (cytosine38-C5)-methyltransferase